jgi:hypothetical protein
MNPFDVARAYALALVLTTAVAGCVAQPWRLPEEKPAQRAAPAMPTAAPMPLGMVVSEVHTVAALQIKLQGKWQPLKNHEDFMLQSSRKQPSSALTDSGWVFVGYGLTVPALGWDNYRHLDVVGKTVVMLAGAPTIPEGALVDSRTLILHPVAPNLGQWQAKIKNAERHGAALALIIQDPQQGGWDALWDFPNALSTAPSESNLLAWGWVPEPRFKAWLLKAGVNWERLKGRAQATDFSGMALPLQSGLTLQNRWREVEMQPGS